MKHKEDLLPLFKNTQAGYEILADTFKHRVYVLGKEMEEIKNKKLSKKEIKEKEQLWREFQNETDAVMEIAVLPYQDITPPEGK